MVGSNVVVSLGIGRGSCQWMVLKPNGESELIAHKFGMTDLPNLGLLSATAHNKQHTHRTTNTTNNTHNEKERGEGDWKTMEKNIILRTERERCMCMVWAWKK